MDKLWNRLKNSSPIDLLALGVCSCFGLGFLPRGPATAGALLGAFVWYLLQPGLLFGAALILTTTGCGIWLSKRVMRVTGDHDPQIIILDEVVGVWTAMLGLSISPAMALCSAIVFRIFDKKKFGPAKALDQRGDALGVMMDDVVAGLYANITLRIGVWLIGILQH